MVDVETQQRARFCCQSPRTVAFVISSRYMGALAAHRSVQGELWRDACWVLLLRGALWLHNREVRSQQGHNPRTEKSMLHEGVGCTSKYSFLHGLRLWVHGYNCILSTLGKVSARSSQLLVASVCLRREETESCATGTGCCHE